MEGWDDIAIGELGDHYLKLCYQYNWLVPMVLCTN